MPGARTAIWSGAGMSGAAGWFRPRSLIRVHLAVAELQKQFGASVVTQNVDDLHERAGVRDVLHLHGSLFAPRCTACARPGAHGPLLADTPRELTPPRCTRCGGYLRPGVVWFGELLDENVVAQTMARVSETELLVVVGTSGLVFPAAAMARSAPANALIIEINPEPAGVGQRQTLPWVSSAAQALPLLLECLQKKEMARRDQDAQYGSLIARRIPAEEIVPGMAYAIHARNGGVGIAVTEDGKPGFRLHGRSLAAIPCLSSTTGTSACHTARPSPCRPSRPCRRPTNPRCWPG